MSNVRRPRRNGAVRIIQNPTKATASTASALADALSVGADWLVQPENRTNEMMITKIRARGLILTHSNRSRQISSATRRIAARNSRATQRRKATPLRPCQNSANRLIRR